MHLSDEVLSKLYRGQPRASASGPMRTVAEDGDEFPAAHYATLLLVEGVSPAYVQEQLGRSSIELTVGTYGRWLRKKAPAAVDRLDIALPQEHVTAVLVAVW